VININLLFWHISVVHLEYRYVNLYCTGKICPCA